MLSKSFLRVIALCGLVAAGVGSLAACNTVEGVGQDISALGRGMSRAASSAR